MASRFMKFAAAAAVLALGAGGYFVYMARAAQAQGSLAQAPLNVQSQIPAAFIMALDDSGSMRFQTLFPSRDGGALWGGTGNAASFFTTSGELRTSDSSRQFVHVAPYPAPRQGTPGNDNAAIPPIDAFGFSRSHVYNKAYFDPGVTYEPWKDHLGNNWDDADPKAVRVDPNSSTHVFDLTQERRSTSSHNSTHHGFRVRAGMILPAGMKYWSNPAPGCGLNDQVSDNTQDQHWRVLTQDVTATCDVNVNIAYFPATFYLPVDHPAPEGFVSENRVLAPNACTYSWATGDDRCDMYRYEIRPSNYSTTAAYDAAIQNFANWFSYYGARNRSVVAAVTHSLATVNSMRVGYFTINNRNTVAMRDMAVEAQRKLFYDSVVTLGASGTTPNLPAVAHMGEQFRRTDGDAPIQRACQRNAGMLFTDGFSNVAHTGYGNVDGGMGAPFADTHSNTLADIATKYYLNAADGGFAPLRSGGNFPAGLVPTHPNCPDPRYDCNPNLHMNFYGVTLGSRGIAFDPDNPRDPFEEPFVSWPAFQSNQRSTIDDIWHATVNTRGELINANTPADVTAAMRRILQAVGSGSSPSGSAAMTGARIGERSLAVTPGYGVENHSTDWFGRLSASKPTFNTSTGEVSETTLWNAEEKLAEMSPAQRAGRTWYGNAAGGTSRFSATGLTSLSQLCDNPRVGMSRCTASELESLGVDLAGAVDYLLGDQSREVGRPGGTLRHRTTVLGDIVNSNPVVSAPTDDYGYHTLGTFGSVNYGATYAEYMTEKKSRPAMVYIGANDGMLHGFHGGIDHQGNVNATDGGRQMFGYIPRAVLGHMGNLLFPYEPDAVGQKFEHRYYVDGPVVVGDAYFGGGWKTALVATAGAGGRSVFALDVSNPSGFTASSNRLWEIDDRHPDSSIADNIGHVLGRPVIAPFRDPVTGAVSWKAIFGNGYNSVNNKAVLFVVDLATGNVRQIEAVEADGPTGPNGLGNIVVVDRREAESGASIRDGFADTVYAADRKGAVWKFDLLGTSTSIDTPFFTTREHAEDGTTYRQPILGGLVATAGRGGGVMLMFGTGSFSFHGDEADESIQSIYGVEDNGATDTITANMLFQRNVVTDDTQVRTITPGGMSYGYVGWVIDLPAGERVVSFPRVASGVLFIPTYAPTNADGCSSGGNNWLFGLDTRTGAPALSGVRSGDIDGDTLGSVHGENVGAVALSTGGSAPVRDVGVSILSTSRPITPPGATDPLPRCWMRITVPGMPNAMLVPYPCGRQSWRQLQ